MKRINFLVGLVLIVFSCQLPAQSRIAPASIFVEADRPQSERSTVRTEALAAAILRDVTYCRAGATPLKMDIYAPLQRSARPAPALIYIHGGAWISGDKDSGPFLDDLPELLARGYVVFSINYRLAPLHRFPAQIEDCKCAVRSLRANARQHNIDPQRIGVFGSSAGGHLAALLGDTAGISDFEGVGGYPEASSAVQAVATYFGPTDLTTPNWSWLDRIGFLTVFGFSGNWKKASPITYVTSKASPFLIVAGERDELVDLRQSQSMYLKLLSVGVSANLLIVKNCGHEFKPTGGALSPTRAQVSNRLADFFDFNLGRTPQTLRSLSFARKY